MFYSLSLLLKVRPDEMAEEAPQSPPDPATPLQNLLAEEPLQADVSNELVMWSMVDMLWQDDGDSAFNES